MRLSEMKIEELCGKSFDCECGIKHGSTLESAFIGDSASEKAADLMKSGGYKHAYVIADENTYKAAGRKVCYTIESVGLLQDVYLLPVEKGLTRPEPDEFTVGSAVMAMPHGADIIIGVGGGVVNDISKIVSRVSALKYLYIPTALSMDGYTSDSSSVIFGGVKVSLPSKCPDILLCDTEILANSPRKLLLAGIGDMAAKLVSVCEWRISALINGEYYCEHIADMMRRYCRDALDSALDAVSGSKEAAGKIARGLSSIGMAMTFAKTTRPASGVEHYYSHLWDMTALEEGKQSELHGLQVGVGTLLSIRKYEKLIKLVPNREKALLHAEAFDLEKWKAGVREYFGGGAEKLIALEEKEGKYDKEKHKARLDRIIASWDDIISVIKEELIPSEELYALYKSIGHPTEPDEIGQSEISAKEAFSHTGDIRDKYILSRLLWDIGEIL